jgi:hypothetical protein
MENQKLKSTLVPEQFKYVIDRVNFEKSRSISNLVFMLNKHIDDTNPNEFINSELFNRLLNRCIETHLNSISAQYGVLYNLGIKNIDNAAIQYDKDENVYEIVQYMENKNGKEENQE